MPIVRSIYVKVVPAGAKNAEQSWRRVAPPLMMHQPGCRSENSGQEKLRANDDPGRFHFYSRWRINKALMLTWSLKLTRNKKHARHLHGGRPSAKR
jgi:hypothetical protein